MYNKPFDVGLFCGRFQLPHKGHESIIEMALSMCDRLVILVGSSQESGTIRNPFDIQTRIEMLREMYPDRNIVIKALPDLTNEDDITVEWGKYVLKNVRQIVYKAPEIMIYGNDESRSKWFDPDDIKDTTEVIIPRSRVPISATMLREALLRNDKETWFKWHSPRLHKHFDRLRGELLAADPYERAFSKLIKKGGLTTFDEKSLTVKTDILEGQIDFE